MASSDATQRAVLAGLSCGIGLAAPVVMYAATLPFSSVNETVVAGAVPFAVGAVAGVGIYAASLGISEYRAQREERLFQPDAMGGAANLNQHQSEFKTASIPAQQQDATPYAAASASQAQAEQSTSAYLSGLTGAFQRRHADDGVPTIARAADAMDEAEAWSMIDSMLDDDSPVSCDPAHSRDVYQVAIDELTNGGQTGSFNRDDIAAAARAVSFTVQERDLTGTLRIGTIESIMTASFGEILPLYHEHCPHVNTQLVEGDTKTLSDMLMHNEVDLIYTLDDMGYDAQRIKLFECPHEIVIVASPKHPFAAAKQLKLADLVNEPFVLMPQFNSYRHQFDMELAHQKLSIRPFLELESTSMVMQLLEHNPYLSVLPRYTARRRAEEGRLAILPVTDCHMEQWSQLVHHRDKVLTPQIRAMVSVIAQVENIPLHLGD